MLVGRLTLLMLCLTVSQVLADWSNVTTSASTMPVYWSTNIMVELEGALSERHWMVNTNYDFVRSKSTWTTGGVQTVTTTNDFGQYYSTTFLTDWDDALFDLVRRGEYFTYPAFSAYDHGSAGTNFTEATDIVLESLSNLWSSADVGYVHTNGNLYLTLYTNYTGSVVSNYTRILTNDVLYGYFPTHATPRYYSKENIIERRKLLDALTNTVDIVWDGTVVTRGAEETGSGNTNDYQSNPSYWEDLFDDIWTEFFSLQHDNDSTNTGFYTELDAEWINGEWVDDGDYSASWITEYSEGYPAHRTGANVTNLVDDVTFYMNTNGWTVLGGASVYADYVTHEGAWTYWPATNSAGHYVEMTAHSPDYQADRIRSDTIYDDLDDDLGPSISFRDWGYVDGEADYGILGSFITTGHKSATFIQWTPSYDSSD